MPVYSYSARPLARRRSAEPIAGELRQAAVGKPIEPFHDLTLAEAPLRREFLSTKRSLSPQSSRSYLTDRELFIFTRSLIPNRQFLQFLEQEFTGKISG